MAGLASPCSRDLDKNSSVYTSSCIRMVYKNSKDHFKSFAKNFKCRSDRICPTRHRIFRSCATVWKCSALIIADLLGLKENVFC